MFGKWLSSDMALPQGTVTYNSPPVHHPLESTRQTRCGLVYCCKWLCHKAISQWQATRLSNTVYPIRYAHSFVVLCLFVVISSLHCGSVKLQWRHNGLDGVSNHEPRHCLLSLLFECRSKKKNNAPRHWSLWGEFTGDQWIPRTNGQ